MGHIFISYSHKDKKYVHRLQQALQDEGFEVWIDDRIDYGTEWPTIIQKHLDNCDAFVVVLTENAYKSKWVQNELTRAGRKGIPFFPLLLQGDPWLSVEATQYVDVRNGSLPQEDFYKRLQTVVPRKKNDDLISPQPQPKPKPLLHTPKWLKNTLIVTASLLVLFAAFFAIAYFVLPTMPGSTPFARPSELTNLFISNSSNARFDKTTFSPADTIYLSLYLTDTQGVGKFKSEWYYLISLFGKDLKILISSQQEKNSAISDTILYNLNHPYLPGYYRVNVYKDDVLIGLKYFWVTWKQ